MIQITPAVGYPLPAVYEVKVLLKNGAWINGYCRGCPNYSTFGDWLHLTIEAPYEGWVIVKTEEIVYIIYRLRKEEKDSI